MLTLGSPHFYGARIARTAMKRCGFRGRLSRFFPPSPSPALAGHGSHTCPAMWATSLPKSLFSPKIELPGDLGNKYYLLSPQPRAAHTLRIRAADTRVQQWSAWSQPVTFGRCPKTLRKDPSGRHLSLSHSKMLRRLSFCTLSSVTLFPWHLVEANDLDPTDRQRQGQAGSLPKVPCAPEGDSQSLPATADSAGRGRCSLRTKPMSKPGVSPP